MDCSDKQKEEYEGGHYLKMVDEDKDLECSICLQLLKDAMGTPCSHAFCRVCIQKMTGQEENGDVTFHCPDCQQQVNLDKVYPNAFVDRLVRRSDVYCSQQNEGCEWTGTLTSFLQQHKIDCDFQTVGCVYEGCMFHGIKSKINDHESKCIHRIIPCQYCQSKMKAQMLNEHYEYCERILTACPQNDCDMMFPKIEIQKHLNEDCQFTSVSCSFEKFGCSEKVLRKDLGQHYEEASKRHMMLMSDKFLQSQSQIEDLQNEVNQLKNANTKLKNEVQLLKVGKTNSANSNKGVEASSSLNQFNRSLKLTEFLLNGVEQWLERKEKLKPEETHYYERWYRRVFILMKGNEVYQFEKAMFIKLKNDKRKAIYWSSNSVKEQDSIFDLYDVCFLSENGSILGEDGKQWVVETQTLNDFTLDNSKALCLNRFNVGDGFTEEFEQVGKFYGSDGDSDDNCLHHGWVVGNLSDDFYLNDFIIVCLIKKS